MDNEINKQKNSFHPFSDFVFLDLNAVVDAMVEKVQDGTFMCLTCHKTFSSRTDGKRHAEVHLNVSHICIACQKVCKTRSALAVHYTRYHPDEVASPWAMK